MKSHNNRDISPTVSKYGYVLNLSGFHKLVAIYLRYLNRSFYVISNFLSGYGCVSVAKKLDDLDSRILKILLRWFHPFGLRVTFVPMVAVLPAATVTPRLFALAVTVMGELFVST